MDIYPNYALFTRAPGPKSRFEYLDHNPLVSGGLSLDLNPEYPRVNATSLDPDLDQNPHVNSALESGTLTS